jgi:hypothetical protein
MPIDYETLKQKVLDSAKEFARKGPGYSQQRVVLDNVAKSFGGNALASPNLDIHQAILTCWHDLFREGDLSWGYDLDNPDAPFFHVPERDVAQVGSRE